VTSVLLQNYYLHLDFNNMCRRDVKILKSVDADYRRMMRFEAKFQFKQCCSQEFQRKSTGDYQKSSKAISINSWKQFV